MEFAIALGSNLFIGTNGILTVEIDGNLVDFFRVRELFRVRSDGSYLAIDCDVKDKENNREIKLAKSKPVVKLNNLKVVCDKKITQVTREDESTVIKIEQVESKDSTLPQDGPVHDMLWNGEFDSVIRITGEFYAGPYKLTIDNKSLKVGGVTLEGNLSVGTGGLRLTSMGLSF